MNSTISQFLFVLLLQILGIIIRQKKNGWVLQFFGWQVSALAAWIIIGIINGWSPLWSAMVGGLAVFLVDAFRLIKSKLALSICADIFFLSFCTFLADTVPDVKLIVPTFVTYTAIGFTLDQLVEKLELPKWVIISLTMLFMFASFSKGISEVNEIKWQFKYLVNLIKATPWMSLSLPRDGENIPISTGASAWYYRPYGRSNGMGAVVFHGANRLASRQSSARVLIHSLLKSGFVVLAVDRPGFGLSPGPKVGATTPEWDPTPTCIEAVKLLRSFSGVKEVIAVGHSMGCTDVLRLLNKGENLKGAVFFGAGLEDPPGRDRYWYKRFIDIHKKHKKISFEQFQEITHQVNANSFYLSRLPTDHAPILFVRFGIEHDNIITARDRHFDRIPGAKRIWDVDLSNHYFNSLIKANFLIADVRVPKQLALKFAEFNNGGFEKEVSKPSEN